MSGSSSRGAGGPGNWEPMFNFGPADPFSDSASSSRLQSRNQRDRHFRRQVARGRQRFHNGSHFSSRYSASSMSMSSGSGYDYYYDYGSGGYYYSYSSSSSSPGSLSEVTKKARRANAFKTASAHDPPSKPSDAFEARVKEASKDYKKHRTLFEDMSFYGLDAVGGEDIDDAAKGPGASQAVKTGPWVHLCSWPEVEAPRVKDADGRPIGDPLFSYPRLAERVDAGDIDQGSLASCWALASCASVAAYDGAIERLFVGGMVERKPGIHGILYWDGGEWTEVVVDDRIPIATEEKRMKKPMWPQMWGPMWGTEDMGSYNGTPRDENMRPIFAHLTTDNEYFVSLWEKGYAKLRSSYANLKGGFASAGLVSLTGGVAMPSLMNDDWDDDFFDMCREFLKAGALLTLSDDNHVWSLLDARVVDGVKIFLVRNPWNKGDMQGQKAYTGEFSDSDCDFWEAHGGEMLDLLDHEIADDGKVWMPRREVMRRFMRLDILRMFYEEDGWRVQKVSGDESLTPLAPLKVKIKVKKNTPVTVAFDMPLGLKANYVRVKVDVYGAKHRRKRLASGRDEHIQQASCNFVAKQKYAWVHVTCSDPIHRWSLRIFTQNGDCSIEDVDRTRRRSAISNQYGRNEVEFNSEALWVAARSGDLTVVRRILAYGDLDLEMEWGGMSESTPLWTAVRSFSEPDSPAIVKALLEAGADPSGRGFWARPNEEDKKRLMSCLDLADKLHELISQYAEKSASQKRLEAIREMLHNPPSHSSSSSSSGGYYSS